MADNPPLDPADGQAPADGTVPRRRRTAGRNLPVAIVTGLGLAVGFIAALVLAPPLFIAFLVGIVILALVELVNVLRARATRPARPVVLPMAVVLIVGAYLQGPVALSLGLVVTLFAAFFWYLVDPGRTEVTRNVAATVLAVLYVPFLAAHLALVVSQVDHYVGAIIGYALVVVVYDTAAYATGVLVGRHPLAPHVSPSKSWEGAAGATVVCLLTGALALPLWRPWTLASGLTLAAVACVAAPLGDLAESMLKRDLAVKDMGSILPGHGGVLDRIDALLFMAPALYYVLALYSLVKGS
jgi:phosphatidate cytidylyltransferase